MKKTCFYLLLILLTNLAIAQKNEQSFSYSEFRVVPSLPNANLGIAQGYFQRETFSSFSGNFEASKVSFKNNRVMVIGQARLRKAKVMMLTETGDSLWSVDISGGCFKLGRLGKHALLLHSGKSDLRNFKDWDVFASLIDPETGKIIKTVQVFSQTKDYLSEPKFFLDPEGRWFYAGTRKTGETPKSYVGIPGVGYGNTMEFTIVGYDTNLQSGELVTFDLPYKDHTFIGTEMSAKGDLVMAFLGKDIVSAERRNSADGFNKSDLLSFNFSSSKSSLILPFFKMSPESAGKCYLSFLYLNNERETIIDLATFDYEKKKVFHSNEIFERPAVDDLKASYEEIGGINLGRPRPSNRLINVSDIIISDKYVAVLREEIDIRLIPGSKNSLNDQYYTSNDLMIEVYDDKSKMLKRWLVPKSYIPESLIGLQSSGRIIDDKLVVFNNITQKRKPAGLISVFDLSKRKPLTRNIIEKDAGKWMAVEPGAIFWFEKHCLLPYAESASAMLGINARFNSILENHAGLY